MTPKSNARRHNPRKKKKILCATRDWMQAGLERVRNKTKAMYDALAACKEFSLRNALVSCLLCRALYPEIQTTTQSVVTQCGRGRHGGIHRHKFGSMIFYYLLNLIPKFNK